MSFKMPSTQQVRELGDSLGIGVTESYANAFLDFIKPFADGYRLIASLPDDVPEIKYPRGGYYRPEVDCIMFTRTNHFCAVCRHAIERIISLYSSSKTM